MFLRLLCAALLLGIAILDAGCTTLADARLARGTGPFRVYDVPLDTVWKAVPPVVKDLGLDLVADNRQEGYILAQRGITPFSYGENVAIFVEEVGKSRKTRVEVVSKKVMETNIFAPSWANDIFEKLAERLSIAGGSSAGKPANTDQAGVYRSTIAIDDVDAVPMLDERGKRGYREWLTKKTPRAFVIAEGGGWNSTWGTKPENSSDPKDPAERALFRCRNRGLKNCKLYAVDDRVVWISE